MNLNNIFPNNLLNNDSILKLFNGNELIRHWKLNRFELKRGFFPMNTACCSLSFEVPTEMWRDSGEFSHDLLKSEPLSTDVLIFSGMISPKMGPYLKRIYQNMIGPKWVVAIGSCAVSGAPFDTSIIANGLSQIIPVDIVIPGCPPTQESIDLGLKLLEAKMLVGRVEEKTNSVQGDTQL